MGGREIIDNSRHGSAVADAVPVVFDAAEAWCFGWFHPARAPRRDVGIVLCRPLGYEASCSYTSYVHLARKLAAAGFDAFRFDYHGTGDSAGSDGDPGRVAAWLASTLAAIDQLKKCAGVSHVGLFGVRIGATLAAHAADRLGGVDSLVLWAPCVTGRAFVRELRAANAGRDASADDAGLEAYGHLYTSGTMTDLGALDCKRVTVRPAERVLIIGRDDLPGGEAPLAAKYRELGAQVQVETWPGYADMMDEPHKGRVELSTLDLITDWLRASPGASATASAGPYPASALDMRCGPVQESPLALGPGDRLFGILAEPADPAARSMAARTGVLMLNVGGHYRIGPGRIYVNLARALATAGYRALRFDVAGFGDSGADPEAGSGTLYERDCAADIDAAIDSLIGRGCTRIVLLGICTGSFLAFQTALIDPRVNVQVLLNSLRLERRLATGAGSGSGAVRVSVGHASTYFYYRALLNAETYRKLLRGKVDLRGIAGQFAGVIGTRIRRAARRLLRSVADEHDVLVQMRQLAARGTDTLVLVGAGDPARNYMELHLGRNGSAMRGVPKFRFAVIDGTDHTLADNASQRRVIELVKQYLDQSAGEPLPAR